MERMFCTYGEVLRNINVAQDFKAGGRKGYVEFDSREEAELAMDELDGMETAEGRRLRVEWTKESESWGMHHP